MEKVGVSHQFLSLTPSYVAYISKLTTFFFLYLFKLRRQKLLMICSYFCVFNFVRTGYFFGDVFLDIFHDNIFSGGRGILSDSVTWNFWIWWDCPIFCKVYVLVFVNVFAKSDFCFTFILYMVFKIVACYSQQFLKSRWFITKVFVHIILCH